MWPMFLSGFLFMFVFTYIYAFKLRGFVFNVVIAVYILFLAWLFLPTPVGYGRPLANLLRFEFLWIPIILHALAWVFAGMAYLKYRT
jgi:hypothetical protein